MNTHKNLLKEIGLVIKVEGNLAWVNTQSKLACSSCLVESSCGNALLEKYLAGKIFVSKIPNRLNAQIGDEVVIVIAKSSVTYAALLAYGLPLLFLISGSLIGQQLGGSDLASIILGFGGLFAALLFNKIYLPALLQSNNFEPTMISKRALIKNTNHLKQIRVRSIE